MKQGLMAFIQETELSVKFKDGIPAESLMAYGAKVASEARRHQRGFDSCQWRIGDWYNYASQFVKGETRGDEEFAVAKRDTGYIQESLENIGRVCAAIPAPLRNGKLTFNHHVVVYRMSVKEMRFYIDLAVKTGMSVRELRHRVSTDGATCNEGEELLLPQAVPLIKKVAVFQMEIRAQIKDVLEWPKERRSAAIEEVDKAINTLQELRRELGNSQVRHNLL